MAEHFLQVLVTHCNTVIKDGIEKTFLFCSQGEADYLWKLPGRHRINRGESIEVFYEGLLGPDCAVTKYRVCKDSTFKEEIYSWDSNGLWG